MLENRITKAFFMLSLLALLGGSIPHVAWIYHFYETTDDKPLGWIISYSIAASIDVLIMWLSYIQSKGSLKDVRIVWLFTIALALLSWYCNWIYDMVHNSASSLSVWSISPLTMLTSFGTIGDLTPKIISALPLFILAYTYMHRRINASKLSVDDYRNYADELETLQSERNRIKQLKRSDRNANITGFISDALTIGKNVKKLRKSSDIKTNDAPVPAPSDNAPVPAPSDNAPVPAPMEHNTDALVLVASNGHSKHVPTDDFSAFFNDLK